MKNKNKISIVTLLMFTLLLTACTESGADIDNQVVIVELNETIDELQEENVELTSENEGLIIANAELQAQLENNSTNSNASGPTNTQNLIDTAYAVMNLIKDKDMVGLSNYVHPSQGLRFTPLVHINVTFDQTFTPGEVATLDQDTTVYDWGYYYGGPPETSIMMDFNDYYDEFIYDKDFLNASSIGVNAVISWGIIIDNIAEFPNAQFLEFYIQGDQHADGFYWESLKLVFEESAGQLYLTGIVHGQWSDNYGVE